MASSWLLRNLLTLHTLSIFQSNMAASTGKFILFSPNTLHMSDVFPALLKFPFARPRGCEPPEENTQLRHKCPVSKVQLFDGKECWVVMKHNDICSALDSTHLSAVWPAFSSPCGRKSFLISWYWRDASFLGPQDPWLPRDPWRRQESSREETDVCQHGWPGAQDSKVDSLSDLAHSMI